jgi:2-polyprenyl-3-methyl-5-hydroxy-6-metoxy-1,4-benzoquinol methylase
VSDLKFDKAYYNCRKYARKKELVSRHFSEVINWASKKIGEDISSGQGKRALDVGCAYGFASEILTDWGYETFGIDISSWGMRQTENCKATEFLVSDAQAGIPFKPSTFDLVTCFDVLEHLHFPELALQSMLKACKGIFVCTTPNRIVEKPLRKIMNDYDETHISVKSPIEWHKCVSENLDRGIFDVEAFYDLAFRLEGKLFFKSFGIQRYGLTIRIIVKKQT